MPSAECHTDYRLVRCKLNLHFQPKPKRGGPPKKKLQVSSLQSAEVRAVLQSNLQSTLETTDCTTDPCPETLWATLKTAILQSSEEVLGFSMKKNKDWFDESDIQQLLTKKRCAHQAHLAQPSWPVKKAAFRAACSNLQRKLWIIQPRRENPALRQHWWLQGLLQGSKMSESFAQHRRPGARHR